MSRECFDVSVERHIAHVVLNRPEKRNSMCALFWSDLPTIVRDIDENARARVTANSSRALHFSAGIDLGILGQEGIGTGDKNYSQHGAAFFAKATALQHAFSVLASCRTPVPAAI